MLNNDTVFLVIFISINRQKCTFLDFTHLESARHLLPRSINDLQLNN